MTIYGGGAPRQFTWDQEIEKEYERKETACKR
jgi:hypothetical protein